MKLRFEYMGKTLPAGSSTVHIKADAAESMVHKAVITVHNDTAATVRDFGVHQTDGPKIYDAVHVESNTIEPHSKITVVFDIPVQYLLFADEDLSELARQEFTYRFERITGTKSSGISAKT